MNTHAPTLGEDDVVYPNPDQNAVDDVVLTDPGPARGNGGGPEPDITSRRASR